MVPFARPERTAAVARCLASVETLTRVRSLTALLALPEATGVDGVATE
jgi:hypothetical protein